MTSLDLTHPIKESVLKNDYYYQIVFAKWKRSIRIEKTIKRHLWAFYKHEFDLNEERAKKEEDGELRHRIYKENDYLDDMCEVQAMAIARKYKLVGNHSYAGLRDPEFFFDRTGHRLEVAPVKAVLMHKLSDEDVNRFYNEAMERIHTTNPDTSYY